MYNTQFKVKYYDIKEELTMKLKCETEEYEYSVDDVMDICNKLYRDELLSVFWAENLMDDKLDNGLKYVYETMMKNDKFKDIIDELTRIYITVDGALAEEGKLDQIITISLFSQPLFHITHKCICQQLDKNEIDDELLVELKTKSCMDIPIL
jgi:hypothetical protein